MKTLQLQPILVTGSHRSGTTWVGKMLALTKDVYYIHEPFAPNGLLAKRNLITYWFIHLDQDYPELQRELKRIITGRYSFIEAIYPFDEQGKFYYKKIPEKLRQYHNQWSVRRRQSFNIKRPLLKDPFAIFSAEWYQRKFSTANVILVRHPAAFVGSLKRMDWRFNFRNWTEQLTLMERYLYPFESQLRDPPVDQICEAALLWLCIHHVINEYRAVHKDWIFLRHEDLSRQPVETFHMMYRKLDLPYDSYVEQSIKRFTSESNPADVKRERQVHQLKRNSRANIKTWKKRLTPDEIQRVRSITEPVASHFYSDEDW